MSVETESGDTDRKAAMRILALAPAQALEDAVSSLPVQSAHECLRGPETGLVMVRGRAGGGGAPFNLGEVTVTRCTVKLETGEVGHAYVMGRDAAKASQAAKVDAMWQRTDMRDVIEREVIAPLKQAIEAGDRKMAADTAATKVDFFTMVRGED